MNVFIDLFSGLGGASHAFDEHPDWRTIKIDSNTELLDYNRGLHILDISRVEEVIRIIESQCDGCFGQMIIWASPPCTEFSYARLDRTHSQTADDFDLTLLDATRQIIEHFQPDAWIIENVQGARPIFNEELKRTPTQELGRIILWGDFPLISIRTRDSYSHYKMGTTGTRAVRPNWRAKIPQAVSYGLLESLTLQRSLKEWLPIEGIEE